MNASLTLDICGNPITGEEIYFYVDRNKNEIYEGSEFIDSNNTNTMGIASVPYYVDIVSGDYGIWAKYNGPSNYNVYHEEGLLTVLGAGNNPPTILGTVLDQIKPEDSLPWTLDLTPYESDIEDSGADLKWYLTGMNSSLYAVTGINSSDDVLTFIPIANAYGNDEVVLWLEDSEGAKVSQIMWINITSVNDIPYFDPAPPNLFIDFDTPYSFNYTLYVHDIETAIENLILTTSEPTEDFGNGFAEVNGLNVTFYYPQSRVGETILVNLTISDGEGNDSYTIQITITGETVESEIEISSLTLSNPTPSDGEEVTIYAELQNTGDNDTEANVSFYDGDPLSGGIQIGDAFTIIIPSQGTSTASVNLIATSGSHTLYVVVQDLSTGININANLQVTVGENTSSVLVLSVGDINIYRFESGQMRTISVEVTCYMQTVENVHLVVLDYQNLTIQSITPPRTMSDGDTIKFYLRITAPELPEGVTKLERDIIIQAQGDNGIFSNAEELDIVVSESAISLFDPIIVVGAVATGTLATLGAAAAASRRSENWKYLLLLTFAVPLYTRIHGKKTLDNFVRGQVFGHIQSEPGTHFNEIKKTLKIGNGNLAYHLRKLEKEGFIKSTRDKRYRRFYPIGVEVPEEDGIKLSKTQETILDYIETRPKATQKEIAQQLKESQQTVSYNLNVLVREGFLKEEKFKGQKRYEILDDNT